MRHTSLGLIFAWVCAIQTCPASRVVHLDDGKLVGDVRKDREGGEYFAFQSVPYAKPPIGELRFRAPEPNEPWTGILNATTDIPKCLQPILGKHGEFLGQEDCLYLNLYTPKLPGESPGLLPVMVFIHGGAFYEGWASISGTGPEYLMPEGVVLVAIHYRLGALGFLSYEDGSAEISANNGLKDQNLALKWVRKNVANFGGNPNLVTIFGQSAGAASVHLHMLSPQSQGLFHRVIAQSGSALNNWAKGSKNSALLLGKHLGLEGVTGAELGNKLRELSGKKIMQGQQNSKWYFKNNVLWPGAPVVEPPGPNSFLPARPELIATSGIFISVPLMLGYTNRESVVFDVFGQAGEKKINFDEQYPQDLGRGDPERIAKILRKAKRHYLCGTVPEKLTDGYADLVTDVWFRQKIVEAAKIHSEFGTVFLYEFSADTKLNYFKLMSNATAQRKGAVHVDDLGYIFKTSPDLVVDKDSIEDVSISRVVKLWTNFAKFGDPTPEKFPILRNFIWPPVRGEKLNFMNISNSLEVGVLFDENLEFWNQLYKEI